MRKDTKIPESLKGAREPVSAVRKGTQCGGARIPHRLLLGRPPALESSRLYRGLSSHTPFPLKSALPTQVLTVTSSGGTGMW